LPSRQYQPEQLITTIYSISYIAPFKSKKTLTSNCSCTFVNSQCAYNPNAKLLSQAQPLKLNLKIKPGAQALGRPPESARSMKDACSRAVAQLHPRYFERLATNSSLANPATSRLNAISSAETMVPTYVIRSVWP